MGITNLHVTANFTHTIKSFKKRQFDIFQKPVIFTSSDRWKIERYNTYIIRFRSLAVYIYISLPKIDRMACTVSFRKTRHFLRDDVYVCLFVYIYIKMYMYGSCANWKKTNAIFSKINFSLGEARRYRYFFETIINSNIIVSNYVSLYTYMVVIPVKVWTSSKIKTSSYTPWLGQVLVT